MFWTSENSNVLKDVELQIKTPQNVVIDATRTAFESKEKREVKKKQCTLNMFKDWI
jgi:hypothetical protein